MFKLMFFLVIFFNIVFCSNLYCSAKVAIIIDDIGYSEDDIDFLSDVDFPLTASIFPGYKYSAKLAKKAYEKGFEVIIHMPMQSIKKLDPGPGAIYVDMSDEKIKQVIKTNIASVPYAVGSNNHMGSLITQDYRCMKIIINELKNEGMLFIDSLVVGNSVCGDVAVELGMPIIKRNIFLDNIDKKEYIIKQLHKLIKIALKKGKAIAIGHINRRYTLEAIREMIPVMKQKGIVFCYVSELAE
jgi:uncharacterized protein